MKIKYSCKSSILDLCLSVWEMGGWGKEIDRYAFFHDSHERSGGLADMIDISGLLKYKYH